ncbi:MAG: hypothetical protein QNK18_13515 [Gammaproteobacteria bacterium]|nr:hypothetical protein [Gammaproteobacteria bacterium]
MPKPVNNGSRRDIAGKPCVFYDGYWIKWYEPPKDSLAAKKQLIAALTRRLFNHVEHGINMPGTRLNEARAAYEGETEPNRKRVKGAMLAGALFNRATDIFRAAVELQESGVEMTAENELMRECGRYLMEAMEFGRTVKHRHGDEGIDELWGEPLKAFSMPIEAFYESRYIKIAQAMRDIDATGDGLVDCLRASSFFREIEGKVRAFTRAAREKCETLRTDPAIFEIWPSFVVTGDQLAESQPRLPAAAGEEERQLAAAGMRLLHQGMRLISDLARARVSMPVSTREFLSCCRDYGLQFEPVTAA